LRFSSTRNSLRLFPLGLFISVFLINQAIPVIVPSVIPKNVFIAFGILALILPILVTDKLEESLRERHDAR
jgi:hypothetical protein